MHQEYHLNGAPILRDNFYFIFYFFHFFKYKNMKVSRTKIFILFPQNLELFSEKFYCLFCKKKKELQTFYDSQL